LELAGNLPSFNDNIVHPGINVKDLDPECEMDNLVLNTAVKKDDIKYILNNSFGMLGINSSVIIKKHIN
jgi:3-oxoacyl-[acyl-carrier-protein] synthase II